MITVLKNVPRNILEFFFFYLAFLSLMIHESMDCRETGMSILTHLFHFNTLLTSLSKLVTGLELKAFEYWTKVAIH